MTAIGGTLNPDTGEISGELGKDTAVLLNESGSDSEYAAVVDLADLEFETPVRGTTAEKIASDVIRTVAISSTYYSSRSVTKIVEGDSINVDVTISDSASIDSDGNGLPDADFLNGEDFVLVSSNGTITLVKSLGNTAGRGAPVDLEEEVTHAYDTADGPVQVTISSPTLAALQNADSTFDTYDTARLIVSISDDAKDLVDAPAGFDPVTDFDLEDGGGNPLPVPDNLFVRAIIAVGTFDAGRANVTDWTFVGDLPGSTRLTGEISGPGIAGALDDGDDVDAYTYTLTVDQDGQEITANSDTDSTWAEADTVSVNNNDNGDDARDAVQADDGDDTVTATFSTGSAIFASNITPKAGGSNGGDGGNSWCFIATAAYGTPMATEIQTLRQVRDGYMANSALGAAFIDVYYRLSPALANVVAQNETAKQIVRVALVPVITVSKWFVAAPETVTAIVIAMMALLIVSIAQSGRRFGVRVRK